MKKKIMLAVSAILLSASVNLPVKAEAKSSLEEAFRTGITSELTEEESSIYNEYTALQEKYLSLPRTKPVLLDKGATTKEYGAYPTRTGVILITTGGEAGSYVGHAGIVTGVNTTMESMPESNSPEGRDGVWAYENDWDIRYPNENVYGLSVVNHTVNDDVAAAYGATIQTGKPYNWNFTDWDQEDSFYAAQLIYRAFEQMTDVKLNNPEENIILPLHFYHNDNTFVVYEKN